jgi:hypothetical protein
MEEHRHDKAELRERVQNISCQTEAKEATS